MDAPGIGHYPIAPPAPAALLLQRRPRAPADNQPSLLPGQQPETVREFAGWGPVVELPKPVRHLAEAMLEALRPFERGLRAFGYQQAAGAGILKLDKALLARRRITKCQVAGKVPEQVVLKGQPVGPGQIGKISADKSRQMPTRPKKRQNSCPLRQRHLPVEQGL